MANKILTLVIDTAEADLSPVIAAAVDAVHTAGHIIKEIRLATDSGETKVAMNTVEGVTVPEPVPQVTVPAPVVETPVTDTTTTVGETDLTIDETIDEKRDALLAQLEALDQEEETQDTPPEDTPVDPTVPLAGSPGTPVTA